MGIFDKLFGSRTPKTFEEMAPDIVRRINRGLGAPAAAIKDVARYEISSIGKPSQFHIHFMFGNGKWDSVPAGDAMTAQDYADRVVNYIKAHPARANAAKGQ